MPLIFTPFLFFPSLYSFSPSTIKQKKGGDIGMQCLYLEVLNPQHYDFTPEWLVDVVFESAAAVLVCWAKVIQSGIRRRALSSSRAAVRGASEASKQASKRANKQTLGGQTPHAGPEIPITAPAIGHTCKRLPLASITGLFLALTAVHRQAVK